MANFRIQGYITNYFMQNKEAYFVLMVNNPFSGVDKEIKINLPVSLDVYKKYIGDIEESKKHGAEKHVSLRGNLEFEVENDIPF